jgi:uncharacterized membrane protein
LIVHEKVQLFQQAELLEKLVMNMNTDNNGREAPSKNAQEEAAHQNQPTLESLWQFAGQGLKTGDFNTAMVHFYRGEVTRSNTWRTRLDSTTNWAVVTTGAALSFAFGTTGTNAALVILIDTLLVLLFLFIEARRYRYYELWANRVRLMEINYFAGLLSPPFLPSTGWANQIAESLKHPKFPIGLLEALGRRYRRNYAPIFLILAVSWNIKILIHPFPAASWQSFLERAAVGPVPGTIILLIGFIFNGLLIFMGIYTVGMRQSTSEVLGENAQGLLGWSRRFWRRFRRATWEVFEADIAMPSLPKLQRRKQLAYVISDEVQTIGKALMEKLGRGVTLMHGTGMYTGKDHGILMCAVDSGQIHMLKKVVSELDSHAFIIVMPIQEVHGEGFRPLEA